MAEFKVTMKHPELPEGKVIEIDGVGAVKNGESVVVTQEMQDAWSAANEGQDLKKSMAQNGVLDFSGKDKLMDTPLPVEALQEEEVAAKQAAKNEGGEK
jgi:hypothetical protein